MIYQDIFYFVFEFCLIKYFSCDFLLDLNSDDITAIIFSIIVVFFMYYRFVSSSNNNDKNNKKTIAANINSADEVIDAIINSKPSHFK
jgi:hypothetical protein